MCVRIYHNLLNKIFLNTILESTDKIIFKMFLKNIHKYNAAD